MKRTKAETGGIEGDEGQSGPTGTINSKKRVNLTERSTLSAGKGEHGRLRPQVGMSRWSETCRPRLLEGVTLR
jgi:hypothetical protein